MANTTIRLAHDVANQLQAVLGYIELGEYPKALTAIHEAVRLLGKLRRRLASMYNGAA